MSTILSIFLTINRLLNIILVTVNSHSKALIIFLLILKIVYLFLYSTLFIQLNVHYSKFMHIIIFVFIYLCNAYNLTILCTAVQNLYCMTQEYVRSEISREGVIGRLSAKLSNKRINSVIKTIESNWRCAFRNVPSQFSVAEMYV